MKVLKVVLVVFALIGLNGCAMDYLQIIDHPATAQPGDTIAVTLVDYYLLITRPTFTRPYTRDSIHFAMGLPEGWSVAAADYYVAEGMRIGSFDLPLGAGGSLDTSGLRNAFTDSLLVYDQRRKAMSPEQGVATFIKSQSLTITIDTLNTSVTLAGDSIDQWRGYGAVAGISVSKPDTLIALNDTSAASAVWQAVIPPEATSMLGTAGIDTIGLTMIPVFLQAKLVVGPNTGVHTLVYYTKTGKLPADITPPDSSEIMTWAFRTLLGLGGDSPMDNGGLSSFPIVVGIPGAVAMRGAAAAGRVPVSAIFDPSSNAVRVSFPARSADPAGLSVYALSGELVARLNPAHEANSLTATWDCSGAPQGTYVIRMAGDQSAATTVRLFRR